MPVFLLKRLKRLMFWGFCLVLFFGLFLRPAPAYAFAIKTFNNPTHVETHIPYPVDQVWQWTMKALELYPVEVVNHVTRLIETGWIKDPYNYYLFSVPGYFPYHEEVRTRLVIRLSQGDKGVFTIVNIYKTFEYYRGVFEGWLKMDSDGIEEYVIAYRIRQLAYYHFVIAARIKEQEEMLR